jgi:hypothetical protein
VHPECAFSLSYSEKWVLEMMSPHILGFTLLLFIGLRVVLASFAEELLALAQVKKGEKFTYLKDGEECVEMRASTVGRHSVIGRKVQQLKEQERKYTAGLIFVFITACALFGGMVYELDTMTSGNAGTVLAVIAVIAILLLLISVPLMFKTDDETTKKTEQEKEKEAQLEGTTGEAFTDKESNKKMLAFANAKTHPNLRQSMGEISMRHSHGGSALSEWLSAAQNGQELTVVDRQSSAPTGIHIGIDRDRNRNPLHNSTSEPEPELESESFPKSDLIDFDGGIDEYEKDGGRLTFSMLTKDSCAGWFMSKEGRCTARASLLLGVVCGNISGFLVGGFIGLGLPQNFREGEHAKIGILSGLGLGLLVGLTLAVRSGSSVSTRNKLVGFLESMESFDGKALENAKAKMKYILLVYLMVGYVFIVSASLEPMSCFKDVDKKWYMKVSSYIRHSATCQVIIYRAPKLAANS